MTDNDARMKIVELEAENRILRAQLEGDFPSATAFLQTKVWRQKSALDYLNRRVLTQRFVLRTLEELGRGLTTEEFLAAKAAQSETLQGRMVKLDQLATA